MADTLNIYGVTYQGVEGIKATDSNNNVLTYVRPQGTKTITENGTGIDVSAYATADVNVSGEPPVLETITKTYTPTTSQQTETITPSSGYDGIGEVDVTVEAMPTGTEGTPTATKGAVSNHSVAVTPSVTNQAGYISGGTKTGTPVSVSASELVSGTKSITSNGTSIDVTNYEDVDVEVPNSYSASDEGKVVDNGALVSQTAHADVTPTTSDQTIDTTLNNSLKVKGDADLVAGNIKKDVEIFGVTGSYEGSGGGITINEIGTRSFPVGSRDVTYTETTLCSGAFWGTNITRFYAPNLTTIDTSYGGYSSSSEVRCFQNCKSLTEIDIPLVTAMRDIFAPGCSALTSIKMPLITYVGASAFSGATSLPSFVGRNVAIIYTSGFDGCSNLTAVDILGGHTSTGFKPSAFKNTKLNMLVIRSTSAVQKLENINTFSGSPFASGKAGGTLYVPNSMISSFQAASNWSTILGYATNSIKSIESTATDPNEPIDLTTHYADGTLIPT